MAYEVTATRKRPQAFEKLVGQEFVVSTIENAIESGRIAHAYLFAGPRGVGKTSSARLLAKALNCEKGPTSHPCGECARCREIATGSSTDVIEIDGASNTSVNDIRVIKDEVLFPPQTSRYKIYIIDEVHMLSTSAFNALLKTIEEPPEYVIFIFATTELQKVPATIRSRCQQFHFQLIGLENIKACLAEAASEMGVEADEDALFWIAKEGAGSMRDAYTLFDQVASFSGNHITLQGIRDKLGIVGTEQIAGIVVSAVAGDRKDALEALSSVLSKGVSVEQCIRDLTDFFRSLLLAKAGVTSEELLSTRAEDLPPELLEILTPAQLEAALRYLMQCYRETRYSLSPRFELELFVSRLGSLRHLTSPEELVAKLESLKGDIAQGKATVVKEPPVLVRTENASAPREEAPRPFEGAPAKVGGDVAGQAAPPEPLPGTKAEEAPAAVAAEPAPAPVTEPKAEPSPVPEPAPAQAAPAPKSQIPSMFLDYEDEEGGDDSEEFSFDQREAPEPRTEPEPQPTPPPAEKPPMAFKEQMVDAARESDIFGLASSFERIHDITVEGDLMTLKTDSGLATNSLNSSIAVVRDIIAATTGFRGRISAVTQEKPKVKDDPALVELAKLFRGAIAHDPRRSDGGHEENRSSKQ